MNTISFSIIIPTYGREKVLWESVFPILTQTDQQDEVLIIDQNSPALAIPPAFRQNRVRVIHQTPPSLTRARNRGISEARGTHLLFLDDDIIPDKNLLIQLREATQKHPGCIIAGAVDQEDTPDVEGIGYVNLKSGEIKTNYCFFFRNGSGFFCGLSFSAARSQCSAAALFQSIL
ncbi:glycosyltransferase family 2 protein [Fibrobacterota bacterium]